MLSQRESWFLWHIFSKQWQSVNHDTLEILLHIHSDIDLHEERYRDAIDMFLNEYLGGTVRKRKCNLHGHQYPLCRVSKKPHHNTASVLLSISSDEEEEQSQVNAPEDVPLNSISDDEWSSNDEWLLTSFRHVIFWFLPEFRFCWKKTSKIFIVEKIWMM